MQAQDFATIEMIDGVAVIWLDHQTEKMNIVSPDVIGIFDEVFTRLENDPEVKGLIFISRKNDFIAGADIKSFAIEKEGEFRPIQAKGHELLFRIERCPKPVVAAVHGACVGLGTELSLACHAILASNAPRTFLGLPEVKIGILPGGGGRPDMAQAGGKDASKLPEALALVPSLIEAALK